MAKKTVLQIALDKLDGQIADLQKAKALLIDAMPQHPKPARKAKAKPGVIQAQSDVA